MTSDPSYLDILCLEFDILFKKAERKGLAGDFVEYLEQYDLFDMDRARDIIGSESP